MKKLLSILSAIGMTAVAGGSVVACGTNKKANNNSGKKTDDDSGKKINALNQKEKKLNSQKQLLENKKQNLDKKSNALQEAIDGADKTSPFISHIKLNKDNSEALNKLKSEKLKTDSEIKEVNQQIQKINSQLIDIENQKTSIGKETENYDGDLIQFQITSTKNGLYAISKDRTKIINVKNEKKAVVFDANILLGENAENQSESISTIQSDTNGNIYFGTTFGSIYKLNKNRLSVVLSGDDWTPVIYGMEAGKSNLNDDQSEFGFPTRKQIQTIKFNKNGIFFNTRQETTNWNNFNTHFYKVVDGTAKQIMVLDNNPWHPTDGIFSIGTNWFINSKNTIFVQRTGGNAHNNFVWIYEYKLQKDGTYTPSGVFNDKLAKNGIQFAGGLIEGLTDIDDSAVFYSSLDKKIILIDRNDDYHVGQMPKNISEINQIGFDDNKNMFVETKNGELYVSGQEQPVAKGLPMDDKKENIYTEGNNFYSVNDNGEIKLIYSK